MTELVMKSCFSYVKKTCRRFVQQRAVTFASMLPPVLKKPTQLQVVEDLSTFTCPGHTSCNGIGQYEITAGNWANDTVCGCLEGCVLLKVDCLNHFVLKMKINLVRNGLMPM